LAKIVFWIIHLGWVNMCTSNFLLIGPKFTNFSPNDRVEMQLLITCFSDFHLVDPLRRYSRLKF